VIARAARLQHPSNLGEELVLQGWGRNVMQHREGHRAGETVGFERHVGCVGGDDLDVDAGEARTQRVGEVRIEFDGREVREAVSEQVRREAGAGADLEHVVTEFGAFECIGKNPVAQGLTPLVGYQEFHVRLVHALTVRMSRCAENYVA
jgi:hypothetical protein